jgi:hypothetical protein
MQPRTVKVRTIRPHDTTDGLRSPGDEYERSAGEAKVLADKGVVALVAPPKAKGAKAK